MGSTGKVAECISHGRLALEIQPNEVILMAAQDLVRTSVAAPLACKLRVRYGECDPQGVVFNAHFLAYFDDELTLEIAVTRLGTTSITTSYRVLRYGELLVDGTLRHVLVDPKRLV